MDFSLSAASDCVRPARLRRIERAAIALVLLVALAWRLNNLSFGLPSMWDPDEPIFMIKALQLLQDGTLNPKWFGHPGSTTIYLVALSDALVAATGRVSGAYGSIDEFARAAYANPALLFLPARLAMALLGVTCVWLTYVVGRRAHGSAVGLIAAGLLAINALHIQWSQVIRTDIHASVFMMAAITFAISVARRGKLRDYALAGLFTGFAIATKWPAATVFAAVVGAFVHRFFAEPKERFADLRGLAVAGVAVLAGVFVASPFIFFDWRTVLDNVSGEVKSGHLGHMGGSFGENLVWYLRVQVAGSMGWLGLTLALAGAIVSPLRSSAARATLLPAALAFIALISSQNVIWSRWLLPALPLLCIFAAAALVALAEWASQRLGLRHRGVAIAGAALVAAIPSAAGAVAQSVERDNDTRGQAVRWAAANIPPGSSIVVEHLELSLRDKPWTVLYPLGAAGCIDGKAILSSPVKFDEVEKLRSGAPIVDLGSVEPARLASCRADFAMLVYYDLYLAERDDFPNQTKTYERLLAGAPTLALFRPQPGRAGGPVVRILAIPQPRVHLPK